MLRFFFFFFSALSSVSISSAAMPSAVTNGCNAGHGRGKKGSAQRFVEGAPEMDLKSLVEHV